jgi:hypothetical protein
MFGLSEANGEALHLTTGVNTPVMLRIALRYLAPDVVMIH